MKSKLLLLILFIYSISYAQTPDHYVNANATGNNNGSSWTNAYTNLQAALVNATAGDEIWIAAGTYKPHSSSRSVTYDINVANLKIYGGFVGNETSVPQRDLSNNETILSGDLQGNDVNVADYAGNYGNTTRNGDNSYRVIRILTGGENLLLDGLTISDSHTNINTTTTGGAIIKDNSIALLTIRNCIIKNNVSRNFSAGIYATYSLNNTNGSRGSLIIDKCQFSNNMSRGGSGIYTIAFSNSLVDISITNSVFDTNTTADLSSTIPANSGSGAWLRSSGNNVDLELNIFNNTFVNNIDTGTANGIVDDRFRSALAINQIGNFSNHSENATVANTIFWNNTGAGDATSTNGLTRAISDINGDPLTSLNVFNSLDALNFVEGSISTITNTLTADPLFSGINNSDYTLTSGSPAVDSGNNTYTFSNSDIANNQRISNTTVDLGAYEFGATAGIEENTKLEFSLYPNPARDVLNIKVNNSTFAKAYLYNLQGQQISVSTSSEVHVSDLSNGMYIIKVETVDGTVTSQQFIKK